MQIKDDCSLTVIILTFNEEIHIKRCIKSLKNLASRIVVVDSYSSDATCKIAKKFGAEVFKNKFINHSLQLNWCLDNVKINTKWVMKLDADEYIIGEFKNKLKRILKEKNNTYFAYGLNLRRFFLGKWLRYGGLYPFYLTRIWRFGYGQFDNRLMDEHLIINGPVKNIPIDFADNNLKTITWWTEKHNKYSSLEAIELLNLEYHFILKNLISNLNIWNSVSIKRWIKEKIYYRLPMTFRALAYFFYRYIFRFGFLDGREGATFHFLQGFWYRYLVDTKVTEVKKYMKNKNVDVKIAIEKVLGIKL